MAFVLRDGLRIVVRPIRSSDRLHLTRGLERMSPQTRRLRFHGERTRFTDAELDHLVACDGFDRIGFGALGVDETGEEADEAGVARAYRDSDDPTRAEVAIVVVDAWQGLGVGRLLLDVLAVRCREVGIRRWKACVLGENEVAARLIESYGLVVSRRWEGGALEIEVEI